MLKFIAFYVHIAMFEKLRKKNDGKPNLKPVRLVKVMWVCEKKNMEYYKYNDISNW